MCGAGLTTFRPLATDLHSTGRDGLLASGIFSVINIRYTANLDLTPVSTYRSNPKEVKLSMNPLTCCTTSPTKKVFIQYSIGANCWAGFHDSGGEKLNEVERRAFVRKIDR